MSVIKAKISEEGVWRIRRVEKSPVIEVFRVEETGHGDILSDEFINWRIKLALSEKDPHERPEGTEGDHVPTEVLPGEVPP